MNSWTLCLLIGSFLPIPQVTPVTCEWIAPVVKSAYNQPPVKHLPPSWILGQKDLAVRVMARLRQAEAHEQHAHRRQDYRQAWITVSFAQKGRLEPFLESSYIVYGVHPEKVFSLWLDEQRARLGAEFYLFYNDQGVLRPDIPQFSHPGATLNPTSIAPVSEAESLTGKISASSFPRHDKEKFA